MSPQTKVTIGFVYWLILLLALIFFAATRASADYERKDWLPYWADADKDCQSTRQEILIRDSLTKPRFDPTGCKVISGLWEDPYSGELYSVPFHLDVEHIVPLAEADKSGGSSWPIALKRYFANEIFGYNLVVVHRSLNRSKGAKPPQEWKPPNKGYWCEYSRRWEAVKTRYGLTITDEEKSALLEMRSQCKKNEGESITEV